MTGIEKLYFHLFNAITDAVRAIERQDCDSAREILLAAQEWGENAYLALEEDENSK